MVDDPEGLPGHNEVIIACPDVFELTVIRADLPVELADPAVRGRPRRPP